MTRNAERVSAKLTGDVLMESRSVDFDADDLAEQIEKLTPDEIDALSFGVVRLDAAFNVVLYNQTEARASGFGRQPVGEAFFPLTKRMNSDDFRGRIEQAMADGSVNLEIGWVGDYSDPRRDLRIRVQSARDGGIWLCIERDTSRR
jgi:photoactive yellow protein